MCAKKGPYYMVIGEQSTKTDYNSDKMLITETYCDLNLNKAELDLYQRPMDYFLKIILDTVISVPSVPSDLPHIPSSTFLFLSQSHYLQTLEHLNASPLVTSQFPQHLSGCLSLSKLTLPHTTLNLSCLSS